MAPSNQKIAKSVVNALVREGYMTGWRIDGNEISGRLKTTSFNMPVRITVEIDPKYIALFELEEQVYKIRDELHTLGFSKLGRAAEQLGVDIASMELEI